MNEYQKAFSQYKLDWDDLVLSQLMKNVIGKMKENLNTDVLRTIYSCIDLTSLNSDDSKEKIWSLVERLNHFEGSSDVPNVAALCVYPNFVKALKEALTADIKIVSVAGGFPSSQTFTEVKTVEVSLAVLDGAEEIDVVMNVGDFMDNNYDEIAEEISEIKEACRDAKLKVILETGLLKTPENIIKAAILAMYSGADFIKTSTGKVYSGATPEAVYILCDAIKEYYRLHKRRIGIKISGGIKTIEDAVLYYTVVKEVLGNDWLTPAYFRIGASNLADNLLKSL